MNSNMQSKKRMTEEEASCLFVDLTLGTISRFWKEGMADDIEKTLSLENNLKNNTQAKFEFVIAFLALQMNTLFHILGENRAKRMRRHILNYLKISMDNDNYAVDSMQKYESVISNYPKITYAAQYNIPPLNNLSEALGIVLADAFGGNTTIQVDDVTIYNIFSISILGDGLLLFSVDWNWKKFLEPIELIEAF